MHCTLVACNYQVPGSISVRGLQFNDIPSSLPIPVRPTQPYIAIVPVMPYNNACALNNTVGLSNPVMCPGSAEWWLDHKGTKNPESPGMQQYKVTAQCAKHTPKCEA